MKKKKFRVKIDKRAFFISLVIFFVFLGGSFYLYRSGNKLTDGVFPAGQDLLVKANENLPDYDYIIRLDQMKVVWASDKLSSLLAYPSGGLLGRKSFEVIDERYGRVKYLAELAKRLSEKEGGFRIILPTIDERNLLVELVYRVFRCEDQDYYVGKIVDHEYVSDEVAAEYYSAE